MTNALNTNQSLKIQLLDKILFFDKKVVEMMKKISYTAFK